MSKIERNNRTLEIKKKLIKYCLKGRGCAIIQGLMPRPHLF